MMKAGAISSAEKAIGIDVGVVLINEAAFNEALSYDDRYIFINRARVRFFLLNTEIRQEFQDFVRLYLENSS